MALATSTPQLLIYILQKLNKRGIRKTEAHGDDGKSEKNVAKKLPIYLTRRESCIRSGSKHHQVRQYSSTVQMYQEALASKEAYGSAKLLVTVRDDFANAGL